MNHTARQPLQYGTDYRSDHLFRQLYECAVFPPDRNVLQGYERQILGKSRFPRCQKAARWEAEHRGGGHANKCYLSVGGPGFSELSCRGSF